MKIINPSRSAIINLLTSLYFFVAITEIMSELFAITSIIMVVKPMMPVILMVLYYFSSFKRDVLFFLVMLFSSVTNILFIPDDEQMLFYGISVFLIHRILVLVYIFKLVKIKDFIPMSIATIPFLLVFSYLLATVEVSQGTFIVLVIQNFLIAVFGGLAFSGYMMNDNRRNSWLLICGLLFVALQFIVFIEKFFLSDLSPAILRPIAMVLNAFAFYTFYEFVMASEKSDDNDASLS